MRIVWSVQSRDDLREIRKFIARDSAENAASFIGKLRNSINRLRSFPESGHIVPEIGNARIREIIFGRYRIIYEQGANRIEVLAVFHSARILDETQF